jgi:hypothetical protein
MQECKGPVRMAEQDVNTVHMRIDKVYVGKISTAELAQVFLHAASTATYQTGTTLHV